jgi:hypothetical protein
MLRIAFVFLTTLQSLGQPAPQANHPDEIQNALAHAEALYYGARFTESIALLTRIDDALKSEPARLQERVNTKLRLALAHIGLNDTAKAKALLNELYALNSDFVLDTAQYPPKVVTIAAEAKAEQDKIRCASAEEDARAYLESAKTSKLLDLLRASRSKCSGLAVIEAQAADSFYKNGLGAYRRGEFSSAQSSFEATLALVPEHELALQYKDLIQSKLQVGQDRLLLQWQRNFEGRHWMAAAADYKQIAAFNDSRATAAIGQLNGEYRKALSNLVETWNRTCATGDPAAMTAIRNQILELVPDPSFGADIRANMAPCPDPKKAVVPDPVAAVKTDATVKPTTPDVQAAPVPLGCFEMQSQLALTRLKTRVDPVITNEIRQYLKNNSQLLVRVKVRINETGDVTVTSMHDGNPIVNGAVRNAIGFWKFIPVRDQNGPRCVDTEIPIVLKIAQ